MRILPLALAALLVTLPALADDPEPDPAKMPTKPAAESDEVSGAVVIIGYKGAKRVLPKGNRSKDEAKALADQVLKEARAKGSKFFDLVAKYSDDATGRGSTGVMPKGHCMVPALETALQSIEVGQVADVIDTDLGFLVVTRLAPKASASHILIAYKGAERAGINVTRTKEEAKDLAEKIHARVTDGKEDFAAVAKEISDCSSRPKGGDLGTFNRGAMAPAFEDAAFALAPGQISGVVETPFGFHVIKAQVVAKPLVWGASHILFAYKGAMRAAADVTRSKDEAKKAAEEVLKRLEKGEDFAAVAGEVSDCPSKAKGGDLGVFGPGAMVPQFENALKELEVGKLSGVVETPFGFHVIKRTK